MKNKKGNIAIIAIIIVIVAITAGVIGWILAKKLEKPTPQISGNNNNPAETATNPEKPSQPDINQKLKPQPVNTSGWFTYKDANSGLEFSYPKEMNITRLLTPPKDVAAQGWIVNGVTQAGLHDQTIEYTKKDQCGPHMCLDDKSISENFSILSRAGTCPYSESFKKEVESSYELFSGAHDGISLVDGVMNNNLNTCVLKTVGADGFDVSTDNIYFRAAFLNNGKAYSIQFPVFPFGIFQETDDYLAQKGIWIKEGDSYRGGDGDVTNLFENFLDDPMAQKNIETYDKIISTLKFTK